MRVGVVTYGVVDGNEAFAKFPDLEVAWQIPAKEVGTTPIPVDQIEAILLHVEIVQAPEITRGFEELRALHPGVPTMVSIAWRGEAMLIAEVQTYQLPWDKAARRLGLTNRQSQVLKEIRVGRTNREIAAVLGMSLSTVNRHVENILQKLNARNRTQAAAASVTDTQSKDSGRTRLP